MGSVELFFYNKRHLLLAALLACLMFNVFRFQGGEFFGVLLAHLVFGQALVCYIYGRSMVVGASIVGKDDSLFARRGMALFSAICYLSLFLYKR